MRTTIPLVPRLPNLYLGTMTFSWKGQTSSYVNDSIASRMLADFVDFHDDGNAPVVRVDTARIYGGGDSERALGLALKNLVGDGSSSSSSSSMSIAIGTKAHPSQPGGLSPDGIRSQLSSSLDAMKIDSVSEYYLHQPDIDNPLLDSLFTMNELLIEGKIKYIGLSNYHYSEVERAFALCREYGLVGPTYYQGLYNPLNRLVENELLPLLRKNDCRFVAYNPLAAGLLTGKHTSNSGEVREGRFKDNPNYMPRYYTSSNFRALELIRSACERDNISMVDATYRWLMHHSALCENDGILIGASSLSQLSENLRCCSNANADSVGDDPSRGGGGGGKLPKRLVDVIDEAWTVISGDGSNGGPFPYWRSYSSDMPGREDLDQGASYDALKAK